MTGRHSNQTELPVHALKNVPQKMGLQKYTKNLILQKLKLIYSLFLTELKVIIKLA
jgi:hypothetical protein